MEAEELSGGPVPRTGPIYGSAGNRACIARRTRCRDPDARLGRMRDTGEEGDATLVKRRPGAGRLSLSIPRGGEQAQMEWSHFGN